MEPVERDSRGILGPALLRRRVRLTRYPPPPALAGLVDRFWAVRWSLPPGVVHAQPVLTHPAANLSIGTPDGVADGVEARLNGVAERLGTRTLVGDGWTVAAMTTVGGLAAFVDVPASGLTDRVVPLGPPTGIDEPALVDAVVAAGDEAARVGVLASALASAVRGPERVAAARAVAAVARRAETDRSLRTSAELAAAAGYGERSLQRMFQACAGVSPGWVLRRYRLLDAAEAVRAGERVSWPALAVELGYADQAHLTRDFRAALGHTPAAYARAQRSDAGEA